ncbi:MAG: hypothetical protein L6U99_04990 [Clostridium sp.]|nr:MAG: hypothetical protein L6U99_04990 [Clostridium sp.]
MLKRCQQAHLKKTIRDRSFWLSKVSMFCFLILVIAYILVCVIGGIKIEYKKNIRGKLYNYCSSSWWCIYLFDEEL